MTQCAYDREPSKLIKARRRSAAPRSSAAVCPELAVEELLGARHVVLVEMLDDDRDVGVLFGEALQVEIVVQRAKARRRQLDLADAAERMALERVRVADVGVLLALVVARRASRPWRGRS